MIHTIESLESRQLLAGVTILTHGFNGTINGWIEKAADDIVKRAGGPNQATQYVLQVGVDSKNKLKVLSYDLESGFKKASETGAGEIVVKLDWATVSDGDFSAQQIADAAYSFLITQPKKDVRLAELPIHLIGHDRGASVMTGLARDLGRAGIWVDQQTSLDPHAANSNDDIDQGNFGDPNVVTYSNVAYADNYWRTDNDSANFDVDGQTIAGAHNQALNNTVQQSFFGSAHSSVTAYYDGTIDTGTTNGGDSPIVKNWYGTGGSKPSRNQTGYVYSRVVAGARPTDGLWNASGGIGDRTDVGKTGSQWGNAADVKVLGSRTFTAGSRIVTRVLRGDRDGTSSISLILDKDTNPYNNNAVRALRRTSFSTSNDPVVTRYNGNLSDAPAGKYWVYAMVKDSAGHVRYGYSSWIKITEPTKRSITRAVHVEPSNATTTTSFSSEPIKLEGDKTLLEASL